MGVLDELKKEAETVKAQAERTRNSEQAERDAVLKELRPRVQALYTFLKEMTDHLGVVDPDIRASYDVDGLGEVSGLRQQGYRVTTPDNRNVTHFTLHFSCISDGSVKFQVKGKDCLLYTSDAADEE